MNQTLENSQKLNFGPDFGQFGPNLGPQFFFVSFTCTQMLDIIVQSSSTSRCQRLSLYKIPRKIYDPISRKQQKNILDLIEARWNKYSGCQSLFFKNMGRSVTTYLSQLSSCTISEKANDPVLRKVSDRRADRETDRPTDRQTDRQTDKQTGRQTDRHTDRKRFRETAYRQTGTQTMDKTQV